MKKIICAAALGAAVLSFASAQNYTGVNAAAIKDVPTATSFTATTTKGLFSTDVDDFISVTDFWGVQPEKFFGYFGYNYNDDARGFNFGFARQLKKMYVGAYFGGQLDGMKMTSVFNDASGANKVDYTYEADAKYAYTGSILLGAEKFGVKASLYYNPVGGVGYLKNIKPDSGDESIIQQDTYEFYTDLQLGFNNKYSPFFQIAVDAMTAKYYDNNNGYADKGFADLYLRGGFTQNLKSETEGFSHKVSYNADTRWRITPIVQNQNKDGSDEHLGAANHLIQLSAAYKATVAATDKLTLKAKFALPLQVGLVWDEDYQKPIDGDKAYNTARTFKTDIGFEPTLTFAATYAVVPGKFQFNCGTKITVGDLGWNIVATQTRDDPTSSSVDSTSTTVAFGFDSSDFATSWDAGFTAFLGKKVTVDASYNILNKLNNNSVDYSSNSDIWEVVKDVFVQKLEFLVTVKL